VNDIDVKELLGMALGDLPEVVADPSEDVARGRARLRRRRLAAGSGVAAAMTIGALVPLALQSGGTPVSHPAATRPHSISVSAAAAKSAGVNPAGGHVALVAWTGTQPPGYKVSWMPSSWVVQGSTPYALTIAPPRDKDTNPSSFLGKLVVMLQSASVSSPPPGQSQPVNGRPGVFEPASEAGGNTEVLTFQIQNGQWCVVQAPMALGWDSAQLAKFAGGVQVLVTAKQGVG
jgi:hypothetical protein